MTRKVLMILLAIGLVLAVAGCTSNTARSNQSTQESIMMNNPLMANSNSDLLWAIERRNSTLRDNFSGIKINEDALQLLGWAATGRNRSGTGFTVPLARGVEPFVSLYLADESGVRKFSWQSNSFENVINTDIRNQITMMYEGLNVSAIWIYVIEQDKVPMNNMDWAWHAVGAMSQHQYLVAEELGIQVRYLATFGREEAASLLGLNTENQIPAGVMIMAQKQETPAINPLTAISNSGLLQIIERRNSTARGSFTSKEISEDALHLLGWAATGRNRGGTGFVIPLGLGSDPYVSVYLAEESGVRRFSWQSNSFENVLDANILDQITLMNTGAGATAIWIYVIEKDKVPMQRMDIAFHAIGAMSQHQYLVAEEFDIQTRYIAAVNADEVIRLLGLDAENQIPAGVMIMAQK